MDENEARQRLALLRDRYRDYEIVAHFASAESAQRLFQKQRAIAEEIAGILDDIGAL